MKYTRAKCIDNVGLSRERLIMNKEYEIVDFNGDRSVFYIKDEAGYITPYFKHRFIFLTTENYEIY